MADRYWVGGTGNWNTSSTTNWSASSGGASGASVPTSADNVFFDANSNTGTNAFTVTVDSGTVNCLDFTATGIDGAMTLTRTATGAFLQVYGSWATSSNFTHTPTTWQLRFLATSGARTITTNGVVFDTPVQFNGVGGTWQLQDDLTLSSTRTLQFIAGTLDLNNKIITTGNFNSGSSSVRTLSFGTGKFVITGSGGIWAANPLENITVTGTPVVDVTYSGSVGCDISWTLAPENVSVSFNIKAGTYTLSISNSGIRNLDFTGFAGTYSAGGAVNIFGDLLLSSGMTVSSNSTTTFAGSSGTKTITTNGTTFNSPITFNGAGCTWQLQDALTMGATRTLTLTNGILNLNDKTLTCGILSSSNSNARTLNFGIGGVTVIGSSGGTLVDCATITNLTIAGTPVINVSTTTATASTLSLGALSEANSISFNITTGAYSLTLTSNGIRNLNFTGFTGTLSSGARTVYGNLTLSSGMTVGPSASATTFAATSGVKTITTNGKTADFPITFNGVGGTWQLQDALALGTLRALTLTNGTFNANNFNVTSGTFALGVGTKTLTLGSGTWTVLGSGANAWNANTNVTGLTVSPSTATISMNSASAKTFSGGALMWPTLNQGGAGVLTIAQSNTFANITDTVQPATIRFTSGTTQTVSAFSVSGTSGNLITLDTTTAGSRATLVDTNGINAVSFVSIKDIAATGSATWSALLTDGNVDAGNNTGWLFIPPVSNKYMYNRRKSKRVIN